AFGVRRSARGFRLYREIHGMIGIWFWIVFLIVTATSIPLGFSSVLRLVVGNPQRAAIRSPPLDAIGGTTPMRLNELIAGAEKVSGTKVLSIGLPGQRNRPILVTVESGYRTGNILTLDAYTGSVVPAPTEVGYGWLN